MNATHAPTQRTAPRAEALLSLPDLTVLPPLHGSFASTPLPFVPASTGEPVAILDLPATTGAVARGRRWVVDAARTQGASDDVADVIELLASEVLTNAVRHGSTGGTVQAHVVRHGGTLRITVRDTNPCLPQIKDARPDDVGGRGMALVEMLATAWGAQPHGVTGKSVWFEVGLEAVLA